MLSFKNIDALKKKRMIAWLIDISIIGVLYAVVSWLGWTTFNDFYSDWTLLKSMQSDQTALLNLVVTEFDRVFREVITLVFLYNASFMILFRKTPGKKWMGLKLVKSKSKSAFPVFTRVFAREGLKTLSLMLVEGLPFAFMSLGYMLSKDQLTSLDRLTKLELVVE